MVFQLVPRSCLPFIFYAYVVWFLVAGFRLQAFLCPRCNAYALGKWSYQNVLSSRCVRCGLRLKHNAALV